MILRAAGRITGTHEYRRTGERWVSGLGWSAVSTARVESLVELLVLIGLVPMALLLRRHLFGQLAPLVAG